MRFSGRPCCTIPIPGLPLRWLMAKKKSWREKLADSKGLPKVTRIGGKMKKLSPKWGQGTCVIPAPMEVDEVMRKVPKGKLLTIHEIRGFLAKKHRATIGCPITTGIFAWIAAHAADEAAGEGKKRITPYWRTLKSGGELNPKYPGGIANSEEPAGGRGASRRSKGKAVFCR